MENEAQNSRADLVEKAAETADLVAGQPGFTPGPWKVETPLDGEYEGDPYWDESYPRDVSVRAAWSAPKDGTLGYQICRMSGVNDRTMANARLIAAAPALYEALHLWITEARFWVGNTAEYDKAVEIAIAALALASKPVTSDRGTTTAPNNGPASLPDSAGSVSPSTEYVREDRKSGE